MSFTNEQRDFFKQGRVLVSIPRSLDELDPVSGNGASILDVEQRDRLFIDERLKVFVILDILKCDEAELRSYIPRLNIAIDVWAGAAGEDITRPVGSSAANRDLIFSEELKHEEDPVVLLTQGEDDQVRINLVWETIITVHRPRVRLVEPCVTIIPSVEISPHAKDEPSDVVLEPFISQEVNVFQALEGVRGFENHPPYLPASRLRTVLPSSSRTDTVFHFNSVPSAPIRIFPVIITRIKYTRPWGQSSPFTLTASVDVELVAHVNLKGTIGAVNVRLASGTVEDLSDGILPLACQTKDCVTFLYNLRPQQSEFAGDSHLDVVTVSIHLKLDLSDGCQPNIQTESVTNIDFAQVLGQPQTPVSQSLQRANKPSSLPLHRNPSISLRPGMSDGLLTISFAAPLQAVKVGRPFVWRVLVVNRTEVTKRLAIVPLPRIQRTISQVQQYARRHASRNSSVSIKYNEKDEKTGLEDVAQAAVDENVIYAMQHSGGASLNADVVSLTSELKIGPLFAGQCYEDEIRMVAFRKGPCLIDAIRVVDLQREAEEGPSAPGVIVDIRDIPDIFVEE